MAKAEVSVIQCDKWHNSMNKCWGRLREGILSKSEWLLLYETSGEKHKSVYAQVMAQILQEHRD